MTLTLITALCCGGKTTLANKLAQETGATVVHADDYRYIPGTWTRKTAADFEAGVITAIAAAPGDVIYETTYNDVSDAEQARIQVFNNLLTRKDVAVIIIKPMDLKTSVGHIIDRCIGRAMGTEPQGFSPETSTSRAEMILKNVRAFDANVSALNNLEQTVLAQNIPLTIQFF